MKTKLTKNGQVKWQDKPAFIELLKADGWIVAEEEKKDEPKGRSPKPKKE